MIKSALQVTRLERLRASKMVMDFNTIYYPSSGNSYTKSGTILNVFFYCNPLAIQGTKWTRTRKTGCLKLITSAPLYALTGFHFRVFDNFSPSIWTNI